MNKHFVPHPEDFVSLHFFVYAILISCVSRLELSLVGLYAGGLFPATPVKIPTLPCLLLFNFWSLLISPSYSKRFIYFFKPGQQVLLFYKSGTSPWTATNHRKPPQAANYNRNVFSCLGPAAIFSWPLLNYKCIYSTVKRISVAALPAAGLATVCSAHGVRVQLLVKTSGLFPLHPAGLL